MSGSRVSASRSPTLKPSKDNHPPPLFRAPRPSTIRAVRAGEPKASGQREHILRSGRAGPSLRSAARRGDRRPQRTRNIIVAVALVVAAFASLGFAPPRAPQQLAQRDASDAMGVDVEVALAVDVSYSMDPEEQALQREGYMAAITSSEFMHAVSQGMPATSP